MTVSQHTVVLTSSGYVYTWGSGIYGSLGHGFKSEKSLTIPCLVENLRELNVVSIGCCAAIVSSEVSSIRASQSSAFSNRKEDSDCTCLTFIVEKEHIHANAEILSKRSAYFRANTSKVIDVPHFSKRIFLLLIQFLYVDGLTVKIDEAVELYYLADMYQLDGLAYSCMSTLERNLCIQNVFGMLKKAIDFDCSKLKSICLKFVQNHSVVRSLKEEEFKILPFSVLSEIESKIV